MATTTPSDPPRLMATGKASEVNQQFLLMLVRTGLLVFVLCQKLPQQKILGVINAVSNFGTRATFSRTPTTP
ncbi:MAG: hypothetical protein Ct9H90mP30_0330 [Actinomycetota bacterium]|nr:MAG: hypothetical protein Ct9H90mP30_0330 [Actinomycetota bacterium]